MDEYRVDLRDLLVPGSGVTPRWVFMLIKELPVGSRFFAEKRGGPQFRDWDEGRFATVAIVNAVRALHYTYVTAHIPKGKKRPPAPEAYPIPERKTTQTQAAKPGSFAYIVAQHKAAAAKAKREATG